MALTRAMLKGMGLTDEQVAAVIEGHSETVEGLKDKLKEHDGDAQKIKELEDKLKALEGGKDWQAEYDKLKKEFDDYKADIDGRETLSKVKTAYKTLLDEEKIDPTIHELILRGTDFSGKKLNADGGLEDADKLREEIRKDYAAHVVKTETRGANAGNQASGQGGGSGKTREEIMAIKDTGERQRAIAENHELFGF